MATSSATRSSRRKSQMKKRTKTLYNEVRSILDKSTSDNLNLSVYSLNQLEIKSVGELRGVVDIIYERAVNNPESTGQCAAIFAAVQHFRVRVADQNNRRSVRSILLDKCQSCFERESETDGEVAAASTSQQRVEGDRRKYAGNVRLIGEIYKLKMLTPNIMLSIIDALLSQLEEEKLECLCALLTSVGEDLDRQKPGALDPHFERLKEIADVNASVEEMPSVSSLVRSIISNVITLRENKWVP